VAAATVATLAGFSSRAEHRLGESLAAFGPNLTVRPQVGGPSLLPENAVARLLAIPGVRSAALSPDRDRVEVRADPSRLEGLSRAIEARIEGVEAVPLLRVSQSDARLTRRLTLVLVSVGAATTALVGERRTEIGLLLALGFTGRRVGGFLAAELLAAAVLAGAVGEVAGELAAGGLARRVLGTGSGMALTWGGFAAAALVAVLVVGSSMAVALRRVERLDAARVLRGE
jgi:hypothetical protein